MDYHIINADKRHLNGLVLLEQQCFSIPWTRAQIMTELPDEHHEFLVAEAGELILGYVGMMHVLDEGYISNVAVAPNYRRQGIASALIDSLLHRAEELQLSFVTLEVRESNAPAIALYGRFGFTPVGRRKGYYDAPKEDAILMTTYLK